MDRPEDDWPVEWQAVWGTRDGFTARLEARLVAAFLAAVAHLPRGLIELGIGCFAHVAKRLDKRHTDAARRFLRQALGDLPKRELEARVVESYRHFVRVLVQSRRVPLRYPPAAREARFDIEWTDDAHEIANSEKGCVVLTGHLGNWEAGLWILSRVGFGPMYAVAKPPKNLPLSKLAQEEREKHGVRLLPRRGAMTDAPRVIRAGGTVGMLLDQRARKRPVLAPFFGRLARCDRSAGVLLRRLQAPVLVVACTMQEEDMRFRLEFVDCLRPEEFRRADPVEIATRINQAYERMIRACPEQYFWLHDRFKDTPETYPDASPPGADADPIEMDAKT